jgi:hypothetical protein
VEGGQNRFGLRRLVGAGWILRTQPGAAKLCSRALSAMRAAVGRRHGRDRPNLGLNQIDA